jgi:hypothetical protein
MPSRTGNTPIHGARIVVITDEVVARLRAQMGRTSVQESGSEQPEGRRARGIERWPVPQRTERLDLSRRASTPAVTIATAVSAYAGA